MRVKLIQCLVIILAIACIASFGCDQVRGVEVASKQELTEMKLVLSGHEQIIMAMTNYIADLQSKGVLPKPEEPKQAETPAAKPSKDKK
jgi:hypothetical protein